MIRTAKANNCKNEIIQNIDKLFAEYENENEALKSDIFDSIAKAFEKHYK